LKKKGFITLGAGRIFGGTLMVGVLPCSDPADSSHLEVSVLGGVTSAAEPQYVGVGDSSILNSSNLNTTKQIRCQHFKTFFSVTGGAAVQAAAFLLRLICMFGNESGL